MWFINQFHQRLNLVSLTTKLCFGSLLSLSLFWVAAFGVFGIASIVTTSSTSSTSTANSGSFLKNSPTSMSGMRQIPNISSERWNGYEKMPTTKTFDSERKNTEVISDR